MFDCFAENQKVVIYKSDTILDCCDAQVNGGQYRGSWPAIWMLGAGNGHNWPRHGEIDIVEAVNGDPRIVMSIHSTNHHGGNPQVTHTGNEAGGTETDLCWPQHPPENPYSLNADLTRDPLIAGFEWNVQDNIGQIG